MAADGQRDERERAEAVAKSQALCPTCRTPIGEDTAEVGEHVGGAPTFVMQPQPQRIETNARGRGGRGGRGGGVGGGRGGRGGSRR